MPLVNHWCSSEIRVRTPAFSNTFEYFDLCLSSTFLTISIWCPIILDKSFASWGPLAEPSSHSWHKPCLLCAKPLPSSSCVSRESTSAFFCKDLGTHWKKLNKARISLKSSSMKVIAKHTQWHHWIFPMQMPPWNLLHTPHQNRSGRTRPSPQQPLHENQTENEKYWRKQSIDRTWMFKVRLHIIPIGRLYALREDFLQFFWIPVWTKSLFWFHRSLNQIP